MPPATLWSLPTLVSQPPAQTDLAIVGGGILGLATARELLRRNPHISVCVLERERELGSEQTGHSSGVIHSGIYYEPGSLKARLCVDGARELYDYCERHEIPSRRSGKLIVATEPSELPRLDELERRARANAVPGVRRVDAAQIRELEPHARGVAALHSPNTGVVDFRAVALALARDVLEAGGSVVTGCELTGVGVGARGLRLAHAHGETTAGHMVCCAGAWSDRLAVAAGASADPRIVPFRGAYLQLAPERAHLVRSLIYPVPDPALPFLGLHLTRRVGGERARSSHRTAPCSARDAYRLGRVRRARCAANAHLARRIAAARSLIGDGRTRARRAAQPRRWPARPLATCQSCALRTRRPAFAGVRAQALARDGRLIDDVRRTRLPRPASS